MRPDLRIVALTHVGGWRGTSTLVVCLLVFLWGCELPQGWFQPAAATPAPLLSPATASESKPDEPEDVPLALVDRPGPGTRGKSRVRLDAVLTVLHVQVPRDARDEVAPIWNHVRESVLDPQTELRLRENGLRVGLGHGHWWDAIKATFDAIHDVRSHQLESVRVPPNYPLALELDAKPHEQTLFFVAEDGILTGQTWRNSRNVLRVRHFVNLEEPEVLRLEVVPEVRQRLEGFRWVRSESGLTQVPNYSGRAFAAAGFTVDIEPGEFLLIAPGPRADVFGMVGGALLVHTIDDRAYDSYVFLRADVNHVARRD